MSGETLESLARKLDEHRRHQLLLEQRLAQLEADNLRLAEQYVKVERQNGNLANLYVATYLLHGTLDRHGVVDAIKEITVNFVGSEELALFERVNDELRLVSSCGIDPAPLSRVPVGEGLIGAAVQCDRVVEPSTWTGCTPLPAERTLSACVPLRLAGDVVGALAIFRLLPQKQELDERDREMLAMLSTHAAPALHGTGAFGRFGYLG